MKWLEDRPSVLHAQIHPLAVGVPAASPQVRRPAHRTSTLQNVMRTDAALRFAWPWNTASMLLPSGSRTKAA